MRLYNTLTRQVEEFQPIEKDCLKLYTCGPTVYSYYHVGNLRNAVFNDTLRRALEASGYSVKHVMNITDVGHLTGDSDDGQDKLEKGAAVERKSVSQVAEFYTDAFKRDISELNILPPNGYKGSLDTYARATSFISQQIEIIKILLQKGFAYQTDQAIYFDTTKLIDYGKLAGQRLADKEVGARPEVITDSQKHHPQDFAVWFFTVGHFAGHSMKWSTPWGEGFPGWHLECSAIIHATLGDPIDIHTGAVDLIGTHHTNEIAQTEAAFGHRLANYWLHNEYLLIDNQRMAKSAANFYTLADIKSRGYDPLALRLLFLQAHYRSQMNFTWESLGAVQTFLKQLQAWADLVHQPGAAEVIGQSEAEQLIKSVLAALDDDLNSAQGLAHLSKAIDKGAPNSELLNELDRILGLKLGERADISDDQKKLIKQRETARQSGDWDQSDQLREQLKTLGIEIKDTPEGSIWMRA
ncbi:MAG TPA: cysteine--tRNA ligase [Candidatus Saccharimonadales bacterium]|nr:cysteine--tRNA ligase [Candidatus Saccharimonadales bacterium]